MSAEGMAPDEGEELDPRRDAVRVGTTAGRDNRFLGYCVKDMSQESSALRQSPSLFETFVTFF
jgi:hypothetical protein